MDLLALCRNMESDLVERKSSAQDMDRIREAICAFANDLPNHRRSGVIFVGQDDDGTCANLAISDELLKRLANLKDDGKLLPFPSLEVRRETLDHCAVAVIIVHPSQNPPVRLDNRVWIRVGPRRDLATPEEEKRLVEKRKWGNLPHDAQGVAGATIADLDLVRFELEFLPSLVSPEALAANSRTILEQLRALRLINQDGQPTVAAMLSLGKEPRHWFPGAYIDARRIAGTLLTGESLDQREISASIVDQLTQIDQWMDLQILRPLAIGASRHSASANYPIAALQQLVRNAVMHRSYEGTNAPVRVTWYEDRIEIQSPGGPYGQVTRANFGEVGVTDYRNPTLAGLMKSLGFVERFGMGLQIARAELMKNGNPMPVFTVSDQYVHVSVKERA